MEEWQDECLPAADVCPLTSWTKEIQYVTFTAGARTQTCVDQMKWASSQQQPALQGRVRALFLRVLTRRRRSACNKLPQGVVSHGGNATSAPPDAF